jgi:hypothetical protein
VAKNLTLSIDEEVLRRASHEAAKKGISLSKLVGQMLEREMRQTDAYWKAFERWKQIKPIPGQTGPFLTRDEAHERKL